MMTWMNEGKEGKKKEESANLVFRIFDDQIDGRDAFVDGASPRELFRISHRRVTRSLLPSLLCLPIAPPRADNRLSPRADYGSLASFVFGCCVRAVSEIRDRPFVAICLLQRFHLCHLTMAPGTYC
jgi:hypothetical protein